jgi:hypothetical protein
MPVSIYGMAVGMAFELLNQVTEGIVATQPSY